MTKPIDRPVFEISYACGCAFWFKMISNNSTISEIDEKGEHFSLCDKHHNQLWQEMIIGQYAFKPFKKR